MDIEQRRYRRFSMKGSPDALPFTPMQGQLLPNRVGGNVNETKKKFNHIVYSCRSARRFDLFSKHLVGRYMAAIGD